MGLREELTRGIYAYGFEKPSAIQQRSVEIFARMTIALSLSPVQKLKSILLLMPWVFEKS